MDQNDLSFGIIGCVYTVHSNLGPDLLESTYETCLEHELMKAGFMVEKQKLLPVIYDGLRLDVGYRVDLLVNQQVILELKSIQELAPIHTAQLMTYLKLSGLKLGLLLNFNVVRMRLGIKRVVM